MRLSQQSKIAPQAKQVTMPLLGTRKPGTFAERLFEITGKPSYYDMFERGDVRLKWTTSFAVKTQIQVSSLLSEYPESYVVKYTPTATQKKGDGAGRMMAVLHLIVAPEVIPYPYRKENN
jgi:hypothetical protein